ncbi:MAG: type I-U CRISPR-associated helicase/endonuclease Cas3 [Gemmatimonadaceae bacterium]|nr:type I-U CRISPR-associated helicase/endonuclease Cas3 [Gemmatimonadaceae bacterium]
MAAQVHATGAWPDQLDVPTGCGKTATLDIATWLLAHQTLGDGRAHPRRVFFVVDRRVVVDSAYDRARFICSRLADATDGPLGQVADALRRRGDASIESSWPPLRAVRLRGATMREPDWARSAAEPLLVVSTVDQVGSRLMFRGYGLTRARRPVHAGLVGMDALLLLDEAHLSRPFLQTARALARANPADATLGVSPVRVVTLTATPGEPTGQETQAVSTAVWSDPALSARLTSRKPTRLVEVKLRGDDQRPLVAALVSALDNVRDGLTGSSTPFSAAIIVNRVDTARGVFDALRHRGEPGHVHLLIGPSRPLDRDAVTREVIAQVASARRVADGATAEPVVVVATQCLEAGADLDFDVLITQSASLDALRQRFGRLDRLGRHHADPRPRAALVHPLVTDPDPIYGESIGTTVTWLTTHATDGVVPFGLADMQQMLAPLSASDLGTMLAPAADAPLLLPGTVDLLTETSQPLDPDVDVSVFLHGPVGTPQVSIAWRESLDPRQFDVLPVSSLECLTLPIWRARRLLTPGTGQETAFVDLDGVDGPEPDVVGGPRTAPSPVSFLIIRNGEVVAPRTSRRVDGGPDLRSDDIVVLPTSAGGCDRFGVRPIDPRADREQVPVLDHSEIAGFVTTGWLSLRVSRARLSEWLGADHGSLWNEFLVAVQDDVDEALSSVLSALDTSPERSVTGTAAVRLLGQMLERSSVVVATVLDESGDGKRAVLLQVPPRREMRVPELVQQLHALVGVPLDGDVHLGDSVIRGAWVRRDGSVESHRTVTLDDHVERVRLLTARAARACAVAAPVAVTLDHAARLHDDGKRDRRFQAMLRGVSRLSRFDTTAPLAKSGRRGVRGEDVRAGLPEGWRHEAHSVSAAANDADVRMLPESEQDLVLGLIATHHGQGRSFYAGIETDDPQDAWQNHLSADQAARAVRLTAQFGPNGVAWLEALFRLADCAASASPEEGGHDLG